MIAVNSCQVGICTKTHIRWAREHSVCRGGIFAHDIAGYSVVLIHGTTHVDPLIINWRHARLDYKLLHKERTPSSI